MRFAGTGKEQRARKSDKVFFSDEELAAIVGMDGDGTLTEPAEVLTSIVGMDGDGTLEEPAA